MVGLLVAVALRFRLVSVQVRIGGVAIAAVGTSSLTVMATWSVLVQPLVLLVISRVYVPSSFTVGVRVLAPLTILPLVVLH